MKHKLISYKSIFFSHFLKWINFKKFRQIWPSLGGRKFRGVSDIHLRRLEVYIITIEKSTIFLVIGNLQ